MSVPFDFEAITADGQAHLMVFRAWGVGSKQQYASNCSQRLLEEVEYRKEQESEIPRYIGFRFTWEGVQCSFNWELKKTK